MLIAPTSQLVKTSNSGGKITRRDVRQNLRANQVRSLERGECLFQNGDRRGPLYRVTHGALCHYMRRIDGSLKIIEFVFKGDIIGFAHLDEHISTARALVMTEVSVVACHEFSDALEIDGHLAARVTAAADREFDCRRSRAIRSGEGRAAVRVASFLAALVRMSMREGRDPHLITNEISTGVVAGQLHMSIDCLATALIELESQGLIQSTPAGLRITDVDLLERILE